MQKSTVFPLSKVVPCHDHQTLAHRRTNPQMAKRAVVLALSTFFKTRDSKTVPGIVGFCWRLLDKRSRIRGNIVVLSLTWDQTRIWSWIACFMWETFSVFCFFDHGFLYNSGAGLRIPMFFWSRQITHIVLCRCAWLMSYTQKRYHDAYLKSADA